jgi:hypothetical protein
MVKIVEAPKRRDDSPGDPVGPEVVAAVNGYLDTLLQRAGSHSPTDPLFVRRLRSAYVPFNLQAMDGLVAGWYRRAGDLEAGAQVRSGRSRPPR